MVFISAQPIREHNIEFDFLSEKLETPKSAQRKKVGDILKQLAAGQNSDGSFGSQQADKYTLIDATTATIINFYQNAVQIGIFR